MCISFRCLFFFFKQKTAYEMRISDWSSDVCSSDLLHKGVAVIRLGFEIATEGGLRIGLEDREIEVVVVSHQQRRIIGDQFGEPAEHEQDGEDPQRLEAAAVAADIVPAAMIARAVLHWQEAPRS